MLTALTVPLDDIEKVLKIAAYIVGAAWVYFKYFKGRTYRPRLESRVSGELCRKNAELVRAIIQVKNVGLGKVDIRQAGTGLRILTIDPTGKEEWVATLPILERHSWVEPGELLEEHAVYALPLAKVVAVKLEIVVTGKKSMWEASTILM